MYFKTRSCTYIPPTGHPKSRETIPLSGVEEPPGLQATPQHQDQRGQASSPGSILFFLGGGGQ